MYFGTTKGEEEMKQKHIPFAPEPCDDPDDYEYVKIRKMNKPKRSTLEPNGYTEYWFKNYLVDLEEVVIHQAIAAEQAARWHRLSNCWRDDITGHLHKRIAELEAELAELKKQKSKGKEKKKS
jgi:hypothetical protein